MHSDLFNHNCLFMCGLHVKVVKDLPKLASDSCGGLNLEEELKKYLLPSPPRTPPKTESRKRKIALSGPEAQKRLKEGNE